VTHTPATSRSAVRYRLATFGTLTLAGPGDSTVLGTHGHHRRRLALLAVLAAAGERGRSRDQLLGLFWPDATQPRARHALEQLLYSLRSSISESVFATSNPVRLNTDVVESDVGAFAAALEGGELEAAVDRYKGSFLDGFYVDDAPEFERWVEMERTRLATCYADALDRLAQHADAARDYTAAVRWWRKLAQADPLSSKNATGLIRALSNSGDHASALQYAERYEAAVAEDLGTSVGPAVASVVAEVRGKATSDRVAVSSPSSPPPRARLPAELTPPGMAPVSAAAMPNDASRPEPTARRPTPYVVTALAVGVLIATAALLRATMHDRKAPARAEPSIAVLPLANVSRNPQDAALVDGLTEELIAVLAKLGGLRVTARTSAFVFKNSTADVRRIADSLGVSYILEGGVQRADSQMRVEVRLVDARDGSTRWSETYDRKLRDIFAVESNIASEVARELDVRLGGATLADVRRRPTTNIAAYELYLRGINPSLMRSDSLARTAVEDFRQAIALDSTYAAAYAGLARVHTRLAFSDTIVPRRDHMALAEQAALKAVALDDALGDAHAALGHVRREQVQLASAEIELKRAVALEPRDARFHLWLSQLYAFEERPADALAEGRRALELDPLAPAATGELARALFLDGRCDEALAQLDKLRALQPPLLRARSIAAQCYARKAMWPEAIAEAEQNAQDGALPARALVGHMLARAGRTDEARRILTALEDRERRAGDDAFGVAAVYAGLGEKDRAFAWLDKAVQERAIDFQHLPIVLESLQPDRRVDDLRRRLGIQTTDQKR
jgi:TolB-like protein/DNA-binding SARP family transcriptional activator